ncbi:MAG TPA: ATP-binding protein [Alphaproteobacteria bacterium]|nr:ATP-binding protein [Alphaproteobacteria bacterium]
MAGGIQSEKVTPLARKRLPRGDDPGGPGAAAACILNALPDPVLMVGEGGAVQFANFAAENFFAVSAEQLCARRLQDLVPADSPLLSLIEQVHAGGHSVFEYGVTIAAPRIGDRFVTIQVTLVPEWESSVVVTLRERSFADKIDHQLTHRSAARSVTGMAAVLAHEIKNPLSGIRGAAQLLEQNANTGDRKLTELICDETDRICALVDRMEVFSEKRGIEREAVNIHRVLEHVRRLGESGFARGIRFVENYDPSLPPVHGNRDQLIQVLLNLVKNAAEACPKNGGEIVLSTAYQHGVRLAVAGSASRMELPLMVSVQDNGDGIPEDLRSCLFDPFVTTKAGGTGLGLALVAKIINDHGGVIEFDSQPRRTVFRVRLPMFVEVGEGA